MTASVYTMPPKHQQYVDSKGFTWVKTNPSGVGFHLGLGYHSRQNAEICLLAAKGKRFRRVDNAVPNLVVSLLQEHTRKSDEVHRRIERLYGNVQRVELFAQRSAGPRWKVIDNEIDDRDIGEVIRDMGLNASR